MFGGNGKNFADTQRPEVLRGSFLLWRVDFVHCQKKRFAQALQQSGQLHVRRSQLRACVHHHHNRIGFFQRHLGLAKYLRGNQGFVVRNNSAGVYHAQQTSVPVDFTIETVPRDAGLIAHNGAARSREPIEERGFAHVGPAHDRYERRF